ncbi:RNA polymerase sigma-70 factor [Pedobacter alluvionis]|uniref:RNA polymerase sigma-70 factor n=1 Tax=Pedobacter alluvionis TaxID=475253 RepID=A0A497XLM5_9SPHI|nr:RNA polymerase sigma-70 factor [Pedobacter alluvionis]RLJ69600.1 RNA polymerase sigma-70 factor (ECF subfamily) [Pedobacter alluvionis]TFB28340.1 RNA polymerase sigma-70 factor [Pedobacter alluvionis]
MFNEIKDLSDAVLLKKHKNGSSAAFDLLFKRYYSALYRYALKNSKDNCVAEELVMDVMLGLWKKQGDLSIETDLAPYLYRAVKNALYNHYRKKIMATVELDEQLDADAVQSRPADDALVYAQLEEIYREKLAELSPARRKVFQMSREENKTYAEIASDMNLSVNTVENYMVAALSFFRKHIKEHADFTLFLLLAPHILLFLPS